MIPERWTARLDAAKTADQVVDAVIDYLASLPPEFLATLPPGWEPPHIRTAQDVCSYAFLLMSRCLGREDDTALLGTNRFFMVASHRIAAILRPGGYTPRPVIKL